MSSPSGLQKRTSVWFLVVVLTVWQAEGQSTQPPSVSCPSPQLLCGGSTCYNPTTQYCSQAGSVVQCIAVCGSQCYNSSMQQCFNGTLCSLNQQLCTMRYTTGYSFQYNPPILICYDPKYQACLNNTLCSYPYQVCNGQCMGAGQACVDNVTVCNFTYSGSDINMKLCNGVCYNSAVQQCVSGSVRCNNNCSGVCFNSSAQQCFNGTLCSLNQQLCTLRYAAGYLFQYNPPLPYCYDPKYQACLNNTICSYPNQVCNGQCMGSGQACADNVTVCNVTYSGSDISMKLCNGVCYNSAVQQCVSGSVRCNNNCSGVCFNSSAQQCFNGTVCSLNQQLCTMRYAAGYYSFQYNPPFPICYDPKYQACLNNTLCSYPNQVCNGQCMGSGQACADNVTVCNVTYSGSDINMKLCNGVCYNSAVQQCVGGYTVNCIRDPSTQQCINQTTNSTQPSNTTSGCCSVKECTTDADCCVQGNECRCSNYDSQGYGSCLNPNKQPASAEGCSAQGKCRNDPHCCKCQCGQVTFIDINGNLGSKKQCVPR